MCVQRKELASCPLRVVKQQPCCHKLSLCSPIHPQKEALSTLDLIVLWFSLLDFVTKLASPFCRRLLCAAFCCLVSCLRTFWRTTSCRAQKAKTDEGKFCLSPRDTLNNALLRIITGGMVEQLATLSLVASLSVLVLRCSAMCRRLSGSLREKTKQDWD